MNKTTKWIIAFVISALAMIFLIYWYLNRSRGDGTGYDPSIDQYEVSGHVIDSSTGHKIPDAKITLIIGPLQVDFTSDSQGAFIYWLPKSAEWYGITVEKGGYLPYQANHGQITHPSPIIIPLLSMILGGA